MTTIATQTSPTATPSTSTLVNPAATLGKDDFLRLLVTQLRYQDPLKPTDQGQFMSQMAQFSTVEGITNLESTLEKLNSSGEVTQAVALIGKTVSYLRADGSTAEGVASSVSLQGGALTVKVGGVDVSLSNVLSIAGASAPAAGA